MNTPDTTRQASSAVYTSRMCICDFGGYTARIMYFCIDGQSRWQGFAEPKSWKYV